MGPNTRLFLQLTADDAIDRPMPSQFGSFKRAAVLGSLEALRTHQHCAIRIHVDADVNRRLAALTRASVTVLLDGLSVT